jgi:hypothetical protein
MLLNLFYSSQSFDTHYLYDPYNDQIAPDIDGLQAHTLLNYIRLHFLGAWPSYGTFSVLDGVI